MVSGSLEWRGSGQLILVVEDQEDLQESLRRLLELYGYRIETAADGRRGLTMLIELRPSLALIDEREGRQAMLGERRLVQAHAAYL